MAENKIIITCDSTQDLGAELIEKNNIKVHPLIVSMGDDVYTDGQVTPDDLYDYYNRTGNLSKTAAPGPEVTENFLRPFVEEGYTVIHFPSVLLCRPHIIFTAWQPKNWATFT